MGAARNGQFSDGVDRALADEALQVRLKNVLGLLKISRKRNVPPNTATDEVRERGKLIRAEVIAHLGDYLEQFIKNAEANGIRVHLARTDADARRIVLDIAKKHSVKRVAKGKSMVSEECHIREALEHEGMEVTETDLGELLVQLAGEPPSHLIAPAIHMNHEQMARVLSVTVNGEKLPADPKVLMSASRAWLRKRFLEADMGMTGANFGIAETGSFFIVTNEGNGRLSATLPKVHVAMMGIERLLPNLASMPTILQLLTRCGTGQHITVYVSLFSGPRKRDELHGPEEQHLILVDNGRSRLLGTEYAEALECIRCGACLNACPVYEKSGGHTYQSVYAGPIGKIVTPLYGTSPIVDQLPHASSLCGACKEACPVKIDIPNMLIKLRREHHFAGKLGGIEPFAVAIASRVLASPGFYKIGSAFARIGSKALAKQGWVKKGPGPLSEWTLNRDLPAPNPKPFRERWRERQARK
jgi:L-lactate dehydrogenase complex protein LldF